MVSGLFSARTVVHLSTAPATASFEHAVAVCTEAAALNTSTTALIARRVCIISSLIFGDIPISARSPFLPAAWADVIKPCACCSCRERARGRRAAEQRDELAPLHVCVHSITSSARRHVEAERLRRQSPYSSRRAAQ